MKLSLRTKGVNDSKEPDASSHLDLVDLYSPRFSPPSREMFACHGSAEETKNCEKIKRATLSVSRVFAVVRREKIVCKSRLLKKSGLSVLSVFAFAKKI